MLLNPDQAALENEAKIVPLINEKKRLFNELLTTKGTFHNFLVYLFPLLYDKLCSQIWERKEKNGK